jgi:type IV secretory pathway VirB6-like protein
MTNLFKSTVAFLMTVILTATFFLSVAHAETEPLTLPAEASVLDTVKNRLKDFDFIKQGGEVAKRISGSSYFGDTSKIVTQFFFVLSVAALLQAVVLSIISKSKFFEELMLVASAIIFFKLMLVNYDKVFVTGFSSVFNSLTSSVSGSDSSTSSIIADSITDFFMMGLGIFVKVFNNLGDSLGIFSLSEFFYALLIAIPLLYAAWITIVAGIKLAIAFLMGDILAGVAIAVGPFFIAAGVLNHTREWFSTWLGFLLSSLGVKVVAVALIAVIGNVIHSVVAMNPTIAGGSSIVDGIIILLISMTVVEAVAMIPSIASSLFVGRMGVSSIRGGNVSIPNKPSRPAKEPKPEPKPTPPATP